VTIPHLLEQAREIWGQGHRSISGLRAVIIAMGVVYGDICRWERDQGPTTGLPYEELEKELGNLIFSTIRWCDDLGFDPEACVQRAIDCQKQFVRKQRETRARSGTE
jgi:hypothetical protein